jgi:hypothetical protein
MKLLAFFCTVILAVSPALAEITPGTTTPLGPATAAAPNWSAAIQKFGKEKPDVAQDTVDTRLLIDHLSDNDPVVKGAAAGSAAALAPMAGASAATGKPGESKGPLAGASPSDLDKFGSEEEWATNVRHSISDIVKPYQEFLSGSSDNSPKPGAEGATSGPLRGSYVSGGPAATRKSEERRRVENVQSEHLISQLIDELLPWGIGVGVVVALGYGLSLWLSYVKNKPSVSTVKSSHSNAHSHSGKKRHRRSI